jgi:hypothetical protein
MTLNDITKELPVSSSHVENEQVEAAKEEVHRITVTDKQQAHVRRKVRLPFFGLLSLSITPMTAETRTSSS